MALQRETLMQAQCFQWRDKLYLPTEGIFAFRDMVYRIKNELDNYGHTHKTRMQQLGQNNATGITKGIWDELIMRSPLTWIEYKIPPNGLTKEQKRFQSLGEELGHIFFVVTSLEQYQKLYYELIREDYGVQL